MSPATLLDEPELSKVAHSPADAELLARARGIIAGSIVPPPMEDPEFDAIMAEEFAGYDPPPTAEAIRYLRENQCLPKIYGGEPVLCFTMAVVAVGERDIYFLLRELPDHERCRVVVRDTLPW
jgi:hypothetical protein